MKFLFKKILIPLLLLSGLVVSCVNDDIYPYKEYQVTIDGNWPVEPINETTILDFYSINDFHGAVEYRPDDNEIGINRLATYFNIKRENNPDGMVLLSAGDMWQGSADSNITYGKLVTEAMNLMQFDAMAIGNHEFDWTDEIIHQNKEIAQFPLLGANIYDKRTNELASFAVPYTLIDRAGVRIGIIGTIGPTLETSILPSAVANYEFINITNIVKTASQYLRKQGAKAVVLANHNGTVESGALPYLDVVFNGHTHRTTSETIQNTPVLQASYNGRAVAHVQFEYTKSNNKLTLLSQTVDTDLVNMNLVEDAQMKALYDDYLENEIGPIKDEVIGQASGPFTQANVGYLATDAILEYGEQFGVVAAFHNIRGIRASIDEGTVTYGDLYKALPFDNELIIVEVTGSELLTWVDYNLYYSGVNKFFREFADGQPIVHSQTYKIISINYLIEQYNPENSQFSYPHNRDTTYNTFQFTREIVRQKWLNEGLLDPSDYQRTTFS
jgi:2',3'-cyclic-nucleotide 2'-phosphodiesterase (5'-nucleotidase family)